MSIHDHHSTVYAGALATYLAIETREELMAIEAMQHGISEESEADPFDCHNAGERLRAVRHVLDRRHRSIRIATGQGTEADRNLEAMNQLRDRVLELVDVPRVLDVAGIPITQGSRRGDRIEYHSPCPCGQGEDRFVSWSNPRSLGWCRQCGVTCDAIALARTLRLGGSDRYVDNVHFLARLAALDRGER